MIDPDVLDALVESGCTAEQIASAVKAACASADKAKAARREKDRIRKKITRAVAKGECPDLSAMSGGQRGNPRTDAESTDNVDTVSLSPVPLLPPTPPNNPLTPNPIQKNKTSARDSGEKPAKRGHRLPADWTMSGPDLAYALGKGLAEREAGDLFERFCSWAWSASGPNAVKVNWHQAWQGWVQRDGPKIIASRASPSGRPISAFQKRRQETQDILDDLDSFAKRGGGNETDLGFLSRDPGERSQELRGGVGGAVIDLSEGSYRSGG